MSSSKITALKAIGFKPGVSGNPKGRPKAVARRQIAEVLSCDDTSQLALTKTDYDDVDKMMPSMSTEQLKKIANSNEVNIYLRSQAYAILSDLQEGKTATVDKMRERAVIAEQSSRLTTNKQLAMVTGKFKGANYMRAVEQAKQMLRAALEQNNTYTTSLEPQIENGARLNVQVNYVFEIKATMESDILKFETSREQNLRVSLDPLESLSMRLIEKYQDSLTLLGLTLDRKTLKPTTDNPLEQLVEELKAV